MKSLYAVPALLALAACGGGDSQSPSENAADQLKDAAEMSNPAAAPVMENGAEAIENSGDDQNAAAQAQNVLQNAGNAQVR